MLVYERQQARQRKREMKQLLKKAKKTTEPVRAPGVPARAGQGAAQRDGRAVVVQTCQPSPLGDACPGAGRGCGKGLRSAIVAALQRGCAVGARVQGLRPCQQVGLPVVSTKGSARRG